VAWIGDGNNMCNTYIQASKVFDFTLKIAAPKGYEPGPIFNKDYSDNVQICETIEQACYEADLVVTDVWASMGQENEQNTRTSAFKGYQVDSKLMSCAKDDAVFMHCLPAHRGEEVSSDVIDGEQSLVWKEAENRLHAQKSLLLFLLS
jgi:ornithine carbamoyltransferase